MCVHRGTIGIDFNVNLNISTIDFGTFHVSFIIIDAFHLVLTQYSLIDHYLSSCTP